MEKTAVYSRAKVGEEYNGSVFYNKLLKSMAIHIRSAKTAGLTYTFFDYDEENTRMPERKLISTKVLTDLTRLRSTLLHEMCHAASWIIDHAESRPTDQFSKNGLPSIREISL